MAARDLGGIGSGERFLVWRARLFPVLGTGLIIADAVFSGPVVPGVAAALPWVLGAVAGLVLVLSGGVLPGKGRRFIEDEGTRAHRAWAIQNGYIAAVCCGLGLLVTCVFVRIEAAQALRILLTTAIAAPLISFGVQERTALGRE